MAVSGLGVAYAGAGFVLAWSGLKGATLKDTLSAFLHGQLPAAHLTGPPTVSIGQDTPAAAAAAGAPGPPPGQATSNTGRVNQALARALAVASGHPDWAAGQQWKDWVALWNQESGWSATADTRKSGLDPPGADVFAYGLPQARPYSKMPRAAWPADKGGWSDPATQILWGIGYIASRYGSPSAAWAAEVANGSY